MFFEFYRTKLEDRCILICYLHHIKIETLFAYKASKQLHYGFIFDQIQSQLTPAEAYRDKLVNSDKLARTLLRLEWRWEKKLALWTAMTIKVQKVYRGMKGRELYREILPDLIARRKERLYRVIAVEQFNKGQTTYLNRSNCLLLI